MGSSMIFEFEKKSAVKRQPFKQFTRIFIIVPLHIISVELIPFSSSSIMSPNSVGSWISMAVIGLVTAAVVQLIQQHSSLCSNKHSSLCSNKHSSQHKHTLYISIMFRNVPISTVLYP